MSHQKSRTALAGIAALCIAGAACAAAPNTSYQPVYFRTSQTATGLVGSSSRGFGVNVNAASPYYGYIYAGDTTQGGVRVLQPTPAVGGASAPAYTQVGTITSGAVASVNPQGVVVGTDDTVYLANFNAKTVYAAPGSLSASGGAAAALVTTAGSPRDVWVSGSLTSGTLYVAETTASAIEVFTLSSGAPVLKATIALTGNIYGVTADPDGNVYVAINNAIANGSSVLKKYVPNAGGTAYTLAAAVFALPSYLGATQPSGVVFQPDTSAPGGEGYLVESGYSTTSVNKFDVNGNWVSGYGTTSGLTIPAGAAYTQQDLSGPGGNQLVYTAADPNGSSYVIATTNGGVRISRYQPVKAVYTASGIKSSPSAYNGISYFGDDAGKVHGILTATGAEAPGFPVNLTADVRIGANVRVRSRVAVYFGAEATPSLYLTTDVGHVVRINLDGTIAWAVLPLGSNAPNGNTATPAVFRNGQVFDAITGINGMQVVKLSQETGGLILASTAMGDQTTTVSSPSVDTNIVGDPGNVYVGLATGTTVTTGGIVAFTAADLNPAATVASTEAVTAPPYVKQQELYVGTHAGNLYKVNSSTLSVDTAFGAADGTPGRAYMGETLTTTAFPGNGGTTPDIIYVGSNNGKIWQANSVDGTKSIFFDTGAANNVSGLLVRPSTQTVAFTSGGTFYTVPQLNAANYRQFFSFNNLDSAPGLDVSTDSLFTGSDSGFAFAFPAPF